MLFRKCINTINLDMFMAITSQTMTNGCSPAVAYQLQYVSIDIINSQVYLVCNKLCIILLSVHEPESILFSLYAFNMYFSS